MKKLILFTLIMFGGFTMQAQSDVLEIRYCLRTINIRIGPGTNFAKDPSGQLLKGETLYVVQEKDGWVRFRVTPNDMGWYGWVKKDLTVPKNQTEANDDNSKIKLLWDSGLLKKLNWQINEAFVNPTIWSNIDYQTKENIARLLAFYCGKEKKNNINWVDIKDAYSGKKLAKYSEAWGFTAY